jgi:hypothetical protein
MPSSTPIAVVPAVKTIDVCAGESRLHKMKKGVQEMYRPLLKQSGQLNLTTGALLIFLGAFAALTSPALAQSQGGKSPDDWQFTVAPYLMFPWMNGKTAMLGREVEVNANPGDIFSKLQLGVMGTFQARKARWGTWIDAVYMALGTDIARPSANVDANQGVYTFTGLRELNKKVDLVFGARWNVLQGKLDFKGPLLTGTYEQTKQWVNPIVGFQLKQPLGGRWHFTMEGDIGGFGAGSDFAWHLFPVVGIDVGKRATLGVGYRVLSEDYQTGSGLRMFKYDVVTQAFVLGAAFHF